MGNINYFKIIHKYIPPTSVTYPIYIVHSTLVTKKALGIGQNLKLNNEQLQFIEAASMLHDIGIVKVNDAELSCTGNLKYIEHGCEGRKILEEENLPKHALVAERHTGVGITKKEIVRNNLTLPQRNMLAESIEEEIISFADLFYSKKPKQIWQEKSVNEARNSIKKFGKDHIEIFDRWLIKFT